MNPLPPWLRITQLVSERARGRGFDLVQPFRLGTYHRDVDDALRIGGDAADDRLGLVIGNSRALWPAFERAVWQDFRLQDDPHPLDRYCTESLRQVLEIEPPPAWVRMAHELEPAPPVAIQRVAQAAGLAHLAPSHLSIHPVLGPWLALRAVVVFDVEGPIQPAPVAPNPCDTCSKPCVPALQRAVAGAGIQRSVGTPEAWERWLQVRDACPEGSAHRYGEDQIQFHYAKRAQMRRP